MQICYHCQFAISVNCTKSIELFELYLKAKYFSLKVVFNNARCLLNANNT